MADDPNAGASLEELFGPDVLCACEEFESLDGPWAYFVSLLEFLPTAARAELKKRRSDLWNLRFAKGNAETSDRYLSLALEILENAAIDRQQELAKQATPAWPTNQTTWTEDQLVPSPEHPNPAAYGQLLTTAFPWTLPFDAAGAEARAFGQVLGVERYALMEALQDRSGGTSVPSDEAIATEYLGLTKMGWDLITNPAGTKGGAGLSDVYPEVPDWTKATVADLLDRSGLAADELVTLFNTRFLNDPRTPFKTRVGITSDDTCNAATGGFLNIDDAALDRIHRFVRLWRAIGWPMADVDRAVWALAQHTLDGPGLLRIADLARLRVDVKLSLDELLTWWASIDAYDDAQGNSQYRRLFLNPTVTPTLDNAFALADPLIDPMDLADKTKLLADHLPTLVAALGVPADDVARLTAGGTLLTLSALSGLYRDVSLARALKATVADYVVLRGLIATDPFASVRQAREFMTKVRKAQTSGLSVTELAYLLADDVSGDATGTLGLDDSALNSLIAQLRTALLTAATAEAAAAVLPATADTWRNQLGALLRPSDVDASSAIIEGRSSLSQPDQQTFLAIPSLSFLDAPTQAQLLTILPLADPQRRDAIQKRYDTVVPLLVTFLGAKRRQDALLKQLSGRYQVAVDLIATLLDAPFVSPVPLKGEITSSPIDVLTDETFWADPIDATTKTAAQVVLRRLDKHVLLVRRLRLRKEDLPWIATAVADATRGWFDLNGLLVSTNSSSFGAKASFEALEHLIDYNTLRGRQPRDAAPLTDVFDLGEKKSLITTIVPALASRMGWSDEDLGSLVATMGLTPGDFQDERAVARLQAAFTLLGRSGVRAATVADWVADQILPPVTANIVRAARAYVGVEQWSGRAKQVRDRLLEGQRDALVAYFRGAGLPEVSALPSPPAPPSQRFPDEKAIFDRYHVDIEMGATFLTTRLRLALTSIQLFTERCLMNLEPFPLNDEQVRQWKSYMSRYRVWQAAIDILLRPHEYTDITLFTPENERYQTFGRSLSQREVSLASIEDGFRTYLSGLLDLSQLVIAGMYEEPDSGILHVVARTPATPPIYYYTRRDGASWSTLQRITADINAEGAVYPAMFLNLLYVIWPIITSKPDDGWNQNQDVPQAGGSVTVNDPRKHLEIQIGWTVFRDGKWSSKRLSDTISTSFGPEDSDGIAFKAMVEQVSDESGPHQELRVVCGLGTSTMEES